MMATTAPVRISLHNILVATDFSPCSEVLLPYARSLAQHFNSTLILAHSLPPDVAAGAPFMVETLHESAEIQMNHMLESEVLAGVPHRAVVQEGPTWEVLKQLIQKEHIDLIIAGTHGRTGFRHLVMGSVAEEIFRHATCPVLILGPKVSVEPAHEAQITHILLATDLTPDNPNPALYAAAMARENHARLSLLHVATAYATAPPSSELLAVLGHEELPSIPDAIITVGDPAETILEVAARIKADLLVLGAHRPGVLSGHLMDTAYRVICGANCPVLTVGEKYGSQ